MKNLINSLLLCLVICFTSSCAETQARKVILTGHLPEYKINVSDPGDLSYLNALDRIYFFHVFPDTLGNWQVRQGFEERLKIVKGIMRPGQEIFLTVGGGGTPAANMQILSKDTEKVEAYAEALVNFAHQHQFDGIDMDWETYWRVTPAQHVPKDVYIELMTKIRNKMKALPSGTKLKGLACCLDGNQNDSRELGAAVADLIDHINVMVYDAYGTREEGFPHAPMRMFTAALEGFANASIPKHKLLGGVPFYGSNRSGSEVQVQGGGSYKNVYNKSLEEGKPITTDMNTWNDITFNGVDLIKEKTKYVIENGYGGMQYWEVTHDIPYSNEMSLLRAMRKTVDEAR